MATMQRCDESKLFRTSDLYLAAYLIARGLRLWATDPHDLARVVFVLTPRPNPDDLAAYGAGTATANVADFGRALRTLKRALYDAREGAR